MQRSVREYESKFKLNIYKSLIKQGLQTNDNGFYLSYFNVSNKK